LADKKAALDFNLSHGVGVVAVGGVPDLPVQDLEPKLRDDCLQNVHR